MRRVRLLFIGDVVGSPGRRVVQELLPGLRDSEQRGKADHVLVDFHAEATSEKVAMGWHLDGRVTACVGTHTHVPTADARVLPGGTAYVTDVGMTGARGGVIGVRREQALERFLTQLPARFEPSDDDPWLNAVIVDADASGRATGIRQLLIPYSPSSAASNGPVNQTM